MLSALIAKYEANPWETHLVNFPVLLAVQYFSDFIQKRGGPLYGTLQCIAAYAPNLPSHLRKAIRKSPSSDRALRYVEREIFKDMRTKALAGTTLAVDLITGGVKVNALPERAWAVVNHRIAVERLIPPLLFCDTGTDCGDSSIQLRERSQGIRHYPSANFGY
jgi:Gly-Xaa carboxypeptidase